MKNLTRTQAAISVAGLLLIGGQALADRPAYQGPYDSGVPIQNTPELQAIHDSMKRPLHPRHIGANSAFDGKSAWVAPKYDDQLAKKRQGIHPGYLAANTGLSDTSSELHG
jgi:hypothetical protein